MTTARIRPSTPGYRRHRRRRRRPLVAALLVALGLCGAGRAIDAASVRGDRLLSFAGERLYSALVVKLRASDGALGDELAAAVDLDGDIALLGSQFHGGNGTGYVFERTGPGIWQETRLEAVAGNVDDQLAHSVALDGGTAALGAPNDEVTGSVGGSVLLFTRSGLGSWTRGPKLSAPVPTLDGRFGAAVAIDGDTLVVGSSFADDAAAGAGAAFVFERDLGGAGNWGHRATLVASDPTFQALFGVAVAIHGDTIVVGAPFADTAAIADTGAVYVFERDQFGPDNWGQVAKRTALDPDLGDRYGASVAIDGDTAVAGAPGKTGSRGAAYVLERNAGGANAWGEVRKVKASVSATFDGFADSVALDGDLLAAGAPNASVVIPDAGAAFVFERDRGGTGQWGEVEQMTAPDGADDDGFGIAVALSRNRLLAGAWLDGDNGSFSGSAYVFSSQTDLTISKTDGTASATPGGTLTYTITAANDGPDDVLDAPVTDVFPPELACTWECFPAGGAACTAGPVAGDIADLADLPAGGWATYTATCAVDPFAAGTLSNTATVAPPPGIADTDPADNSATDVDTVVPAADLSVAKTDGSATAVPGGLVTYTVTVANAGPTAVVDATVEDDLAAPLESCQWTCAAGPGGACQPAGGGPIADSTVDLAAGASAVYTITCRIDPAATGTLTNTATVAAPGAVIDPVAANDSATDTSTLLLPADLAITKTDGVTAASPGDTLTYTLVVSNPTGPNDVTGAVVRDEFPASHLTGCLWGCVGAGGAVCSPGQVAGDVLDTVDLPVGSTATYTAACVVAPGATGLIANTATIEMPFGFGDPVPVNNTASDLDTALVPEADLAITKDDGQTQATPGGALLYEIEVSNPAGPSDAAGVTVTDLFPAGLACSWSCDPSGGATCTGFGAGDLVDSVDLPVGGSVLYSVPCFIDAQAEGTLVNTATVAAPAGLVDPDPDNDSATDSDTLDLGADLAAVLVSDPQGSVVVGGELGYTVTVDNLGPLTAEQATLAVELPAGITLEQVQTAAGRNAAGVHRGDLGGTLIFYDGFESGDLSRWSASVGGPGGGDPPLGCTVTGSTVSCNLGDLAGGEGATLVLETVVDPGTAGTLVASTQAAAETFDQDTGNNSAQVTVTVESGPVDLALAISDSPDPVSAGGPLTYLLEVTNDGPAAATGIALSDPLPVEVSVVSVSASQGSCTTDPTVDCDLGALAVGGSAAVTIVVRVDGAVVGSLTNAAGVLAAETDLDLTDNTATETTEVLSSSRRPPTLEEGRR